MSPRLAVFALLLTATAAPAVGPPPKRVDRYGDPLPQGAVARLGTVRFRGGRASHLAYTPDGKSVVVGSRDGIIHVFDPKTGRSLRTFGARAASLNAMALDRKGRLLATAALPRHHGTDHDLSLWDFATGKLVGRLKGHTSPVYAIALSPDGKDTARNYFPIHWFCGSAR
jgi:WD40 repeat protein